MIFKYIYIYIKGKVPSQYDPSGCNISLRSHTNFSCRKMWLQLATNDSKYNHTIKLCCSYMISLYPGMLWRGPWCTPLYHMVTI